MPIAVLRPSTVKVSGEQLAEVWWRGNQWAVTEHGLERLDGTYAINKAQLLEKIDEHPWPVHMSRKTWCDQDDFATAWMVSILLHGFGGEVAPAQILAAFERMSVWSNTLD